MPACPVAPAFDSRLRGAPEPPRAPWPRLLAQNSSGAATYLMARAPTTRSWGSSGTATCPLSSNSHLLVMTALELPHVPWAGLMNRELLK
jgi:hypothetical protein